MLEIQDPSNVLLSVTVTSRIYPITVPLVSLLFNHKIMGNWTSGIEHIKEFCFKKVKDQQNDKDKASISFNLSYLHMIAKQYVYLEERTIPFDSDINCYWLANKLRFPTLAKMARDFLVSQATTKDMEGGFSKGRRTIPYYRRRQDAETVRDQMLVNASYELFSRRSHWSRINFSTVTVFSGSVSVLGKNRTVTAPHNRTVSVLQKSVTILPKNRTAPPVSMLTNGWCKRSQRLLN